MKLNTQIIGRIAVLSMSRRQCSVWGCSNRKGRCPEDVEGNRRCNCRELRVTGCPESKALLTLHNVGKMPPEIHRIVVAQLNKTRKGPGGKLWKPGPEAYVCNSHYVGFQGPSKGRLNVIPTLFRRCSDLYTPPAKRERRLLQRSPSPVQHEEEELTANPQSLVALSYQAAFAAIRKVQLVDSLMKEVEILKTEVQLLKTQPQRLDITLLTSEQLTTFTGVSRNLFSLLQDWLRPILPCNLPATSSTRTRYLNESQKLLLVLMRIRQNLTQEDLAFRFDVEQSSVSRVINQWIPLLAHHLKGLIKWPATTIGPTEPPYNHMPNTVAIIDGTEIFIQRPSNLSTQKSSYSEYKSHTTVKYLVSIDPFTGVFNFVSQGFSGNSSDRFVVENSDFLSLLKPGQRILADRGFTARDLIASKRAFLTIPSFLRGAAKLTGQQAMETRTIAGVRIRVENAIKRLKDFHAVSGTSPNRMNKKILDDMVIVACALCNLMPPLIK